MTFKKYHSVTRHGKRGTDAVVESSPYVVLTEKLDGANSSVTVVDGKLKCYSRNTELDESNTLRGFYSWAQEHFKDKSIEERYVLYGEWLVKHKLDYGKNANQFYLFDVWDKKKEKYADFEVVEELAVRYCLNLVPVFYKGEFKSIEHVKSFVGDSFLGKVGEGVVLKAYDYRDRFGNQVFIKFVSDEFAEKMKIKKHKVKDKVDPLTEFIQSALTKARVSKMMHKLVDEGDLREDYAIEDMRDILRGLGSTVYEDIMEEESDELFKIVKRQVGKSVPNVVKQVLKDEGRM